MPITSVETAPPCPEAVAILSAAMTELVLPELRSPLAAHVYWAFVTFG